MIMKVAFIDHYYHKKTISSKFFLDLLAPYCDIDIYWDESYKNEGEPPWEEIRDKSYDLIVLWQSPYYIQKCTFFPGTSFIAIPMFDACIDAPDDWFIYNEVKYICFSKALHDRLIRLKCNCFYIQYFPNPFDYPIAQQNNRNCFFWERRSEISFNFIENFVDIGSMDTFNLHLYPDPNYRLSFDVDELVKKYPNLTLSEWFDSKSEFLLFLKSFSIYIAPRLYEGIGFSFLEAMAMGQCVLASNTSTMNDYIKDGYNGYLYDVHSPRKIAIDQIKEIQKNARATIEEGYLNWLTSVPSLIRFIFEINPDLWPNKIVYKNKIWPDHYFPIKKKRKNIRLSIITPVYNASENDIHKTFDSIFRQDFEEFEFIVIDGKSNTDTLTVLSRFVNEIDLFISEKDSGPYDAMNKGVKLASGEWVIFMNAGDYFISDSILSRVFCQVDNHNSPDLIYGDHIWLNEGIPYLHKAMPLNALKGMLVNNQENTNVWRLGIPGHQATFTKRELLINRLYDTEKFKIAADHDFLFYFINKGYSYLQLCFPVSVYVSGGMSFQNMDLCHKEQNYIYNYWKRIYSNENEPYHVSVLFDKYLKSLAYRYSGNMIFIVTPSFNCGETILKTVQSIFFQEGDFSIRYHIQDGNSTDDTLFLIEQFTGIIKKNADYFINCNKILFSYSSKQDDGMYDAINKGFEQIGFIHEESYMTYLNTDDVLNERAFAIIDKIKENKKISWIIHYPQLFDEVNNLMRKWETVYPREIIEMGLCDSFHWPTIQQEGSFWKKKLWTEAGGLNSKLRLAGDWDLWRRFAEKNDLYHFDYPIALFRKRAIQLSSENEGKPYYSEICALLSEDKRNRNFKEMLPQLFSLKINEIKASGTYYIVSSISLSRENVPHKYTEFLGESSIVKPEKRIYINNKEKGLIDLNKIIKLSEIVDNQQLYIIRKLRMSGLFFYQYYTDQFFEKLQVDPLLHYLFQNKQNFDPNVLFSNSWYLSRYPEVKEAGHNPLYHYVMWGADLGYDPHPDFSTNEYKAANHFVVERGINPLYHYLYYGALEGCSLK